MRGLIAAILWLAWSAAAGAETSWDSIHGLPPGAITAVAADGPDGRHWLAATEHEVWESLDSGETWRSLFMLPGQARAHRIAISPSSKSVFLLATSSGLIVSSDAGATWQTPLKAIGDPAGFSFAAFHPKHFELAAASGKGLWVSRDSGKQWQEVSVPAQAGRILHFAFDPEHRDRMYLVAEGGLFAGSPSLNQWEQRLAAYGAEELGGETPDNVDAGEDEGVLPILRAAAIDPTDPAVIYVAGRRGVRISRDRGVTWTLLPETPLGGADVVRLALTRHSPLMLYLASSEGILRYPDGSVQWSRIPALPGETRVNDLVLLPGQLLAATSNGLYRYAIPTDPTESLPTARDLLSDFGHEPTIGRVREEAVRYAEVHPDKIRKWRRQAALKALLPSFSVGYDRGMSKDISVDEGSFPNFQFIETKDRDSGADFSLDWDLGDLIWNNDQTSIDTRSKLMVELRDDIVDEVTRIYFERRRLQASLLLHPPKDPQKQLDQELRIEELTAMLDGLTDGFFSAQLGPHPIALNKQEARR